MRLMVLCLTALLSLATISASTAQEACTPWVPPPADPNAPPAPPLPQVFPLIEGGKTGTELVLLGDSLTTPRLGQMVSSLSGDRHYRNYAIGGRSAQMLSDTFAKEEIPADAIGIIGIGRNNDHGKPQQVLDSIKKAAAHLSSGKYLVLAVLSGMPAEEQPGGTRRVQIDALNSELQAIYGDRFVPVRPLLTCTDFRDSVHLSEAGQDKVARGVADALQATGW